MARKVVRCSARHIERTTIKWRQLSARTARCESVLFCTVQEAGLRSQNSSPAEHFPDRLVLAGSAVDLGETAPASVGDIVEITEQRPTSPIGVEEAEFIKAACTDDTGRFALLTERFRRELLAHCYRMLASYG